MCFSVNAFEFMMHSLIVLIQFCLQYANWISKTQNTNILDLAANLTMRLFNKIATESGKRDEFTESMEISPFSEAIIALRNMISRAPSKFANKDHLSVLERKSEYAVHIEFTVHFL